MSSKLAEWALFLDLCLPCLQRHHLRDIPQLVRMQRRCETHSPLQRHLDSSEVPHHRRGLHVLCGSVVLHLHTSPATRTLPLRPHILWESLILECHLHLSHLRNETRYTRHRQWLQYNKLLVCPLGTSYLHQCPR